MARFVPNATHNGDAEPHWFGSVLYGSSWPNMAIPEGQPARRRQAGALLSSFKVFSKPPYSRYAVSEKTLNEKQNSSCADIKN
jgi:hypothetical protein